MSTLHTFYKERTFFTIYTNLILVLPLLNGRSIELQHAAHISTYTRPPLIRGHSIEITTCPVHGHTDSTSS